MRFGQDITADTIVEDLSFFDSWEDRYRYIIDLGKSLPEFDESGRVEANLVRGCQSQVWLIPEYQDAHFYFHVDSDAHIVRGLLAIVLAAFQGRTAAEILAFDIDDYFARLQLLQHISPTRGNGLKAMVERIRGAAQAQA